MREHTPERTRCRSICFVTRYQYLLVAGLLSMPALAGAAPRTYFGQSPSNADLTRAHAARNEFVATLGAFAEETMEGLGGKSDPVLFAGTPFAATSDFDTVYSFWPVSVSPTHALLDQGPSGEAGAPFDDWLHFDRPITAFGSYFAQGGDGQANEVTLRLENGTTGTSKEVRLGTLGPAAPFYNIFFFGVTDSDPFDRVTLIESLDRDGMLLDNVVAGWVAPPLLGDFNQSGHVDAADYTVWRDQEGYTNHVPYTQADGDGNGTVDAADLLIWRNQYGTSLVEPSQSAASATPTSWLPEPSSTAWLLGALASQGVRRRAKT